MTTRLVSGYGMHTEIAKAISACQTADIHLRRMINERPGVNTQLLLIAKVVSNLMEILSSLMVIKEIAEESKLMIGIDELYRFLAGQQVTTPKGEGCVVGRVRDGKEPIKILVSLKSPEGSEEKIVYKCSLEDLELVKK